MTALVLGRQWTAFTHMNRLAAALLALAACGGGLGSFTGTVQGNTLELKSALLVANSEIWLSDTKDLCPKLKANQLPRNGAYLKLTPRPVATGDFTVDPSTSTGKANTVTATFFKLNADCGNTLTFGNSLGTAGTVTVTRYASSSTIDGTFDMTIGSNDTVKGSFSAVFCDAPTSYPSAECVTVD